MFLSFAFLVPVQIVFGRSGRRAGGIAAAGLAAVGIAAVQGWRLAAAGASGTSLRSCAGLCLPWSLLGALVLINAPFWQAWAAPYRVLCVTAACALLRFAPSRSPLRGMAFSTFLEKLFGDFLAPLRSALGDGYEASALAASLDPKEIRRLLPRDAAQFLRRHTPLLYRRQLADREPAVGTGQPRAGKRPPR